MNLVDSFVGIFSCWINTTTFVFFNTLFDATDITPNDVLHLELAPFINPNQFAILQESNFPGSAINTTTALLTDGNWHHILASWDFSGPSFVGGIYIDDIYDTIASPSPYTTGTIPWSTTNSIQILNRLDLGAPWFGCVSQFYLNTTEFLDFSIVSNRRKFISGTITQVDLGSNGQLPTGTAPSFYFMGDPTAFISNQGTFDGTFSVVNTFVGCATAPPQ